MLGTSVTSEADLSLGRQVTKFQQARKEDLILKATRQLAKKKTALPSLSPALNKFWIYS